MLDPIFVLTYKNRKDNILKRFEDGRLTVDSNRKVYFVCYDFDFLESGYDKYSLPENMTFLKIDFENEFLKNGLERCVQAKRYYTFNKAYEMGYHYCWIFDDDLLNAWKVSDFENHKKAEVQLEEPLQYLEKELANKTFSIAGYPHSKGSMAFILNKPSVSTYSLICDNFYINLDVCKKEGLSFTPLKHHSEDLMMVLDSARKGIDTYIFRGTYALNFRPTGGASSLSGSYKEPAYNLWKDYGRLVRYIDKNRVFGKNKEHYIHVQIDKKRLLANTTRIADEAQLEMEKATNVDEWTETVHRLTEKYHLKRGF